MGPVQSIPRNVVIVGLLGIIAAGAAFLAGGRRNEPPKRSRPGQTRPLVTLLLECPGPTVPEGREWVKRVVTVEKPIPNGPSTAVESELDLPEASDALAGPMLGGHLDRIGIDHPRHADLKIVLSAIGRGQKEALKAHVIWDGPAAARGMAAAEADRLMARAGMRDQDLDSLLGTSGATRLGLTITSTSTRPVGRFRDWELRFRIGRAALAHDRAYYRQLLFGGGPRDPLRAPNVADYYREVSRNQFTYEDAGSYGPVTWEGWDGSSKTEKCVAVARLLEAQGFDFRPFDTNHDGVVDLSELTVLVIHNDGTAGYGWMQSDPNGTMLEGSRLRAAPGIVFVPHRVDFETLTHELAHALSNRVVDLYGDNEGLNSGLTLMGNTLNNPPDDRTSLYLDAWHRARLGWISRGLSPDDHKATGSIELGSDQWAESRGAAPYLFVIRRSGGDGSESYLFEYRDGLGYDSGVGDRGIVAWHVREDGKGNPSAAEGVDIPGHAIYAVGPDAPRGAWRAWKPSDGRFRLRWSDGSLLTQEFWAEASSSDQGSAILRWRVAGGTNASSP